VLVSADALVPACALVSEGAGVPGCALVPGCVLVSEDALVSTSFACCACEALAAENGSSRGDGMAIRSRLAAP
jgi:hypothetical protein